MNGRLYQGWVIGIDINYGYYKIGYDGSDTKNLTYKEVKKYQNGPPPNQFQQTRIAQANRVVATAQRQLKETRQHTREPILPPQLSFAVYDEAPRKTLEYKDLINHPDPIIQARWNNAGSNEFGSLMQGISDIAGIDTMCFVSRKEIPEHKKRLPMQEWYVTSSHKKKRRTDQE